MANSKNRPLTAYFRTQSQLILSTLVLSNRTEFQKTVLGECKPVGKIYRTAIATGGVNLAVRARWLWNRYVKIWMPFICIQFNYLSFIVEFEFEWHTFPIFENHRNHCRSRSWVVLKWNRESHFVQNKGARWERVYFESQKICRAGVYCFTKLHVFISVDISTS